MNRLMMMYPLMAEAGAEGGGGTGGAPAAGGEGQPSGGEGGTGGDHGGEGQPAPQGGEGQPSGDPKPFLGDPKGGEGQTAPQGGEGQPKPASDEDYAKAMVKDEKLLGNDKNLVLDEKMYKAMIPTVKELGVTPESMNKLANAMAKCQVEKAREAMQDRIAYFEKMKQESLQKYSQKDFEQINSGIDKWFKPNGIMNNVIRNSELGADPEFLALMHYLGAAAKEDGAAGAAAGAGVSTVDPNSADGLAKMW